MLQLNSDAKRRRSSEMQWGHTTKNPRPESARGRQEVEGRSNAEPGQEPTKGAAALG